MNKSTLKNIDTFRDIQESFYRMGVQCMAHVAIIKEIIDEIKEKQGLVTWRDKVFDLFDQKLKNKDQILSIKDVFEELQAQDQSSQWAVRSALNWLATEGKITRTTPGKFRKNSSSSAITYKKSGKNYELQQGIVRLLDDNERSNFHIQDIYTKFGDRYSKRIIANVLTALIGTGQIRRVKYGYYANIKAGKKIGVKAVSL